MTLAPFARHSIHPRSSILSRSSNRVVHPLAALGCLLGALAFGASATRAADCTLRGQVTGSVPNQGFASAVATIGDVNGDGFPDFAVGAPAINPGPTQLPGPAVYVYSGRDGTLLYSKPGPVQSDFGASISALGDVNGDGIPDFIVGAPATNPGPIQLLLPAIHVLSGRDGLEIYDFPGAYASRFGGVEKGGSDVDGDGIPDFVVGAPNADGNSPSTGAVTIHSGATGAILLTLTGEATGDRFGASVAFARVAVQPGPIQSPLLLVGAPMAKVVIIGGQTDVAGAAYLFDASTGMLIRKFNGEHTEDHFGASVAFLRVAVSPGPINAPLLLVGAPNELTGPGIRAGRVDVIDSVGPGGGCIHFFTGSMDGEGFGTAIAGIGDVTGDGVPDILVGAPGTPGSAPVTAGSVSVFAGDNWLPLCRSTGFMPDEQFGAALAELGDLDGDGFPEWIAGAPGFSIGPSAPLGLVRTFGVAPGPPPGHPRMIDIDEDASGILLRWTSVGLSCAGSDYAVYDGKLARMGQGVSNHLPDTCSTGGATQITLPPPVNFPPGTARYFIVTAQTSNEEGSYGQGTAGNEHPQSLQPCKVFLNTGSCQ